LATNNKQKSAVNVFMDVHYFEIKTWFVDNSEM